MEEKVFKTEVKNDLSGSIRRAVDFWGGWSKFIRKGDRVLLKPNFNTSDPYPGSTDKEFLREVVSQILDLSPREILIGASSTMMAKTENVLQELGIHELEGMDRKVKVVNFDKGRWVKRDIPEAKYLKSVSLPEVLGEVDRLIMLPCLKTHFLAQYTGALKLAVGLMRPRERAPLHARHLQEKIAELNSILKPDLNIMDARVCFISKGPMSGPEERPDLVLSSDDRVALDMEGVGIIQGYENNSLSGIEPSNLPQIKRASELNIK